MYLRGLLFGHPGNIDRAFITGGILRWARFALALFAAFLFVAFAPAARAGNIDLYDFAVSVSGGTSGDWQDTSTTDPTLIIDPSSSIYNDTNCCGDGTGGTTKGLGTVNYTFTGAPGTYTVSMYFDFDVSTPFFNEFGTINDGAGAESGMAYEIFNADSTSSNIVLFGAVGVPGGETYGLANDTNKVPGTTDNFLATCTAASCNADVGMALTYTFTLGAGQDAVLTAVASTTNPGGFSLETTHPVDANNTTASNVFLTGSFQVGAACTVNCGPPPPPPTPEPSSWVLLGSGLVLFGVRRGFWRKARV